MRAGQGDEIPGFGGEEFDQVSKVGGFSLTDLVDFLLRWLCRPGGAGGQGGG